MNSTEENQENNSTSVKNGNLDNEKKSSPSPLGWLFIAVGLALFISYVVIPLFNNFISPGPQTGVGGGPPNSQEQQVNERGLTLSDVPIQSIINDRVFWVGPDDQNRVLVVAEDTISAEKISNLEIGQTVNLDVVVKELPSKENMIENWGLTDSQVSSIQSQPGYLSLRDISIM
ncbi:hypothetical protein C4577_04110 [Candidatus Parcubacteria bacterium]|nr:MAG: hypothetical protein C4577_04110 [Candidatus Parcubacteria bacterium]